MFKQFPRCKYKPKLLNVTLENNPPDPFQKQIYDLEELEVISAYAYIVYFASFAACLSELEC